MISLFPHEEFGTGLGYGFARSAQVQVRYFGIVGLEVLFISAEPT